MQNFFIDQLDFYRSISVANTDAIDSKADVLSLAKNFGVDEVYFCDDFPAIFIKNVKDFGVKSLTEIARIHHDVWNYQKVLQLYVISEVEIRIYNCSEKPIYLSSTTNFELETQKLELYRCEKTDSEKLETLNKIFSRIAVDTGIIWTLEEAEDIRNKINLRKRVDRYLVSSLINTAYTLRDRGLDDIDLIHKLIMRSLFLLFLEDRNATDEKFYKTIKEGASTYFDILGSVPATYKLFEELESHFKGNLFAIDIDEQEKVRPEHLDLIKRCFITGLENTGQAHLFDNWRVFNFNIIKIELLSEIYENFLSAIDAKGKEETGTFYTPPSLVELILNQKLPIGKSDTNFSVKILDPACGSGIFLVESFKRLVKRHENYHGRQLTDYKELKNLLVSNIYGIEINAKAIKVAAFSLYLALLENLNPKTLWQEKELPNLICDPSDTTIKTQGVNLFRADTVQENVQIESIKFDLVVGNPPFGTKKVSGSIRRYCDQFGFAKEMVLPFLHKSIKFSPDGEIALIFNTKILTNTSSTYQKFRRWLFNDCYVEKIFNFSILRKVPRDFGGQLFGSAVGPISILFFKKIAPAVQDTNIVYYAPKTYMKMNVLDGIVIDSSDVKYLPRNECQRPDSKIWKIAMWGGIRDIRLIEQLDSRPTIDRFIKQNKIERGLGLQFLDASTIRPIQSDTIPVRYIEPKRISRYHSSWFIDIKDGITPASRKLYAEHYKVPVSDLPALNVFRRLGKREAFKSPHILIKEGLSDWKVCSSYVEKDCSFNSKVIGIAHSDKMMLKGLTCFFNSTLAYYYLFMVSASIGIEREEIKPNEIYDLPFGLKMEQIYALAQLYDDAGIAEPSIFKNDIVDFEKQVDQLIYEFFEIPAKSQWVINDAVNITFPLLFKGRKSSGLAVTNNKDLKNYCDVLKQEFGEFLKDSALKVNITHFAVGKSNPLAMVKLSFGDSVDKIGSGAVIDKELRELDKKLYKKEATNIYFRKKVNYYDENDIFLIRPNQKRFWSNVAALEDANDLILEILNMR